MIKSLCEMKPFLWYYSNEVNRNIEYYYMLSSGMEGFRFDIGKLIKSEVKLIFLYFAGCYYYLHVAKPGLDVPLATQKEQPDYVSLSVIFV